MDVRSLFAYSDNCRTLLKETLLAHPDVLDRPFHTLSKFASVRMLLAHSMAAEERWIEMRVRGRHVTPYEDRASDSLEGLFADWDRIRANTREFLAGPEAEDLSRKVQVEVGGYPPLTLTIEQILFHIANHEVHHRAQISMALQQMGIDPPNFDYCLLHGQYN
jgi:uncharacterized damage-inducible protein DinB